MLLSLQKHQRHNKTYVCTHTQLHIHTQTHNNCISAQSALLHYYNIQHARPRPTKLVDLDNPLKTHTHTLNKPYFSLDHMYSELSWNLSIR